MVYDSYIFFFGIFSRIIYNLKFQIFIFGYYLEMYLFEIYNVK
jgi:hypothetical protein